MTDFASAVTTTTTDPANSLLIRVVKDEHQGWFVTDLVGLRYGYATDLRSAVAMWGDDVEAILEIPEADLGEPLASEVLAYRTALGLLAVPS